MDLSRGCILLARSIDESDIFQNEKWLKVWIWCMIQANHKEKNVPIETGKGKTVVTVKRGQFIFGRNSASKKLKMSPSTVRNIMDKLEKLGNLDRQKDSHYTIVSIVNFDKYQDINSYLDNKKDRQRTGKGQAKDTTNTPNTPKEVIIKPENVTDQTWKDWQTHRKEKKAKITQTVINGFTKQAELAGISLEDAIKESIERNWAGFKAEWYLKDKKNPSGDNGREAARKRIEETNRLLGK